MAKALVELLKKQFPSSVLETHSLAGDETVVVEAVRWKEVVRFLRDDPGVVELEATLDRAGFVILSNAYFRGWKATVDGKRAPILRGNRAMQTIPVTAGTHRIIVSYSCRSTLIGGAISLASWIGLGVWFLRNGRRETVAVERAS